MRRASPKDVLESQVQKSSWLGQNNLSNRTCLHHSESTFFSQRSSFKRWDKLWKTKPKHCCRSFCIACEYQKNRAFFNLSGDRQQALPQHTRGFITIPPAAFSNSCPEMSEPIVYVVVRNILGGLFLPSCISFPTPTKTKALLLRYKWGTIHRFGVTYNGGGRVGTHMMQPNCYAIQWASAQKVLPASGSAPSHSGTRTLTRPPAYWVINFPTLYK